MGSGPPQKSLPPPQPPPESDSATEDTEGGHMSPITPEEPGVTEPDGASPPRTPRRKELRWDDVSAVAPQWSV